MKKAFLTCLLLVMFSGSEAYADRTGMICRTIAAAEAPVSLRGAINRLNPAAVQLCRWSDSGAQFYSVLGHATPISKDVCRYFMTTLPIGPNDQTEYMARMAAGCPPQTPGTYTAVDLVSPADFATITNILSQIAGGTSAITEEFRSLSPSRQNSSELLSFERFARTTSFIHAHRMSRYPGFLNLYSTFEVLVEMPQDQTRFYVLKMRKYFWSRMKVIGVGIAIL